MAASGPSLTADVIRKVRFAKWLDKWRVIVVNDAYKALPYADVLYACDWAWWRLHDGAKAFHGKRLTSHSHSLSYIDNKSQVDGFPVATVDARDGKGFGTDCLHYGQPQPCSGFQAVNLALLFGCAKVVLVGFDMRHVDGRSHFFGDHPAGVRQTADAGYRDMAKSFVPDDRILNATPGSAIQCYRSIDLADALNICGQNGSVSRDWPEYQPAAD